MTTYPPSNEDPRVGQAVDMIQRLLSAIPGVEAVGSGAGDGMDQILGDLNLLAKGVDGLRADHADTTEQLRKSEALRESERHYRTIVEDQPDLLCRFQPDGTLTFTNQGYAEYFGRSIEELQGFNFYQLIPEEERPAVRAHFDSMGPDKLTANIVHEVVSADGEIRWQEWTDRAFIDEHGSVIGFQSIGRDITDRKQAEEALTRSEARRERLISDLEVKNAELERFIYTVSHDLKSPLVTIRGFLGFVERDAAAGNLERLRADIDRIKMATETMRRLLDDLLELSRIGRLINMSETVPLTELAQQAVAAVEGPIKSKGVVVEISSELPAVTGDRQRLLEAFQNLVENAVKFMGDQSNPRVDIGLEQVDGEAVFHVRDNGIGIAPQYHEKVFGLFQRLNVEVEGTGIGLTLVKRIVEFHGGRLWIESEGEGEGCTFFFTLGPVQE